MAAPEWPGRIRWLIRLITRTLLWALALVLAVTAILYRNPGLAILGFFALAFAWWDVWFLVRRAWEVLRTPPMPPDETTTAEAEEAPTVSSLPSRLWAVCEGRWVEVALEPQPDAPLPALLDVVIEPIGGRMAVCPADERPPVPLEMVGLHPVLARLDKGPPLRIHPRPDHGDA